MANLSNLNVSYISIVTELEMSLLTPVWAVFKQNVLDHVSEWCFEGYVSLFLDQEYFQYASPLIDDCSLMWLWLICLYWCVLLIVLFWLSLFFFFNWDTPHARLNSHYEEWSYKKKSPLDTENLFRKNLQLKDAC